MKIIQQENRYLILRIPLQSAPQKTSSGRLEISILKSIAEQMNLVPYGRVTVEKVENVNEVEVDFVEFVFRRQFLQRGNMWRTKSAMFERPVYIGQNLSVDGVQATVQEIGVRGNSTVSGVISENTHFIFRSRSCRIIWLVQLSAEMWDHDQNGDLYFEKFLLKFTDPLIDRWKSLSVSHSLTVIFFTRSLFSDRVDPLFLPGLANRQSVKQRFDGVYYQDSFKVAIENTTDIDRVHLLRTLKKEFWAFPTLVGWKAAPNGHRAWSQSQSEQSQFTGNGDASASAPSSAPSLAIDGNFLEAINTACNLLDKVQEIQNRTAVY